MIRRIQYYCLTLLVLLSAWGTSTPAIAEPLKTLTLEQAFSLALNNNPEFLSQKARLKISEAQIITAGARINPLFFSDNGVAEETYRAGIQQTFELGGKRKRRIALAEAEHEVLTTEVHAALLNLRANVRKTYTQLYILQEHQHQLHTFLQQSEALLQDAKQHQQEYGLSEMDLLEADLVLLNAQNNLESLTSQIVINRNTLASLLNQRFDLDLQLSGENIAQTESVIRETNLDNLIENAYRNRPELQQAAEEIDVTQQQLNLAYAYKTPNLTLAAGPDLIFDSSNGVLHAFIIGSVELPLLNRQKGPIQEALARQYQLVREQEAIKHQIALEIHNAYSALKMSHSRVMRYQTEILPRAQAILEVAVQERHRNYRNTLNTFEVQQIFSETYSSYLEALLAYQAALSDLERALGYSL